MTPVMMITVTTDNIWTDDGLTFILKIFFFNFPLLRSGVLKEHLGAQRSTTARRNRTCSDSSVYDTESKVQCVFCLSLDFILFSRRLELGGDLKF